MPRAKVRNPEAHAPLKKGGRDVSISTVEISQSAKNISPNGLPAEFAEKIKELVRLAQEQGRLTYNDINDVLADLEVTPERLDEVFAKLRSLDIEIVDQAEVDQIKTADAEEDDTSRLDILDDPVRMYLKQMGQVALLTREQEVEISKRIEHAENEIRKVIYNLGFAGKEHIALAEKLLADPPRERFDRVVLDKKVDNRDTHLRTLRKLVERVREIDHEVDGKYNVWRETTDEDQSARALAEFKKADKKLQGTFSKFCFKHKVIEEMTLVAENIHDKLQ
ncbi:MAG TPA: RNA polymerase sigma factor region1.1 domain-containing protein, partial [Verrucomicrobiae bacterium]|nr:RNA polymerase sigma factor region1.1 domain-containing protein [Verrucomicrobiae bacterium]